MASPAGRDIIPDMKIIAFDFIAVLTLDPLQFSEYRITQIKSIVPNLPKMEAGGIELNPA